MHVFIVADSCGKTADIKAHVLPERASAVRAAASSATES